MENSACEGMLADHVVCEKPAKVAAPELVERNRYRRRTAAGIRFLKALIGSVEKGLVLSVVDPRQEDRAAQGAAPIMAAIPLPRLAIVVAHKGGRVHPLVMNKSHSPTLNPVRAALQ